MAQDQVEPSMFGPGAKLVGVMVIVIAAFAMGFSAGARQSAGQSDQRADEINQALYQRMLNHAAWGGPAQQPAARMAEQASAADGEAELAPSGGN
jgi:hypothetical protein